MTTRPINGTQKADVYSFAIVLQELMFRAEPYFVGVDSPRSTYYYYYYGHLYSANRLRATNALSGNGRLACKLLNPSLLFLPFEIC